MMKLSSIPFSYKVMLGFLLLLNLSLLLMGYSAKKITEDTLLEEKRQKLLTLTAILDTRLGPGGYEGILRQKGTTPASRDEVIATLNTALKDITDEVGEAGPGLGVGFYAREADGIVTYGPSSQFQYMVGTPIPPNHPGRTVMSDNKAMVRTGSMIRGDIMNAMRPIEREGKVIGYIWANELTTDITRQLEVLAKDIFFVIGGCFGISLILLMLFARRTMRDVDAIIGGVLAMRSDLGKKITGVKGDLGLVASNINDMAEDIARANEETERAVHILRNVMNKLDAAVYVCDQETHRLAYANEYLCTLMGDNELEGKICHKALYGNDVPCSFCPQKYLADKDGAPALAPYRSEVHSPLVGRDFLVTARLVPWHDGRLLHMEVGTDITDRKALAVAEAANLAQRDFLARMSHEIRTPMNGVLGMTRLAIQASPPPEQLEYLKKIQSSAALLLGIINDILDFSKIEAGKLDIERHAFDMNELVENIRELILPRMQENGLALNVQMDASVPRYVHGDGLRLSQVLLNLMGNAAKFTLEGGVTLDMKAEPQADGTLLLRCEVADTGIGMSDEQVSALFKPFTQADGSTSRKFGGTGLGLSISKALVELMGGTITVRSEYGKGSVFSFAVPLEEADAKDMDGTDHTQPWAFASYEGLRFLVVEDNEINREIAQAALEELGAEVTLAVNGEDGLEAFLRDDFDLIFMDVRMPVMDGMEATRRIRSAQKHDATSVPIIAMTANAMREDREASENAGMNAHIAKPFAMDELRRVIYLQIENKPRRDKG